MSKAGPNGLAASQAAQLKDQLSRTKSTDENLAQYAEDVPQVELLGIKPRRVLKGHFSKVYAMQWGINDQTHLVSAGQDGKLIVWNAHTESKTNIVSLESAWVMACAYSPDGKLVASGGLDNLCSIFRVDGPSSRAGVLETHTGYLSSCKFYNGSERMLTASGDGTCCDWDVGTRRLKNPFVSRDKDAGDVMSVSLHPNEQFFVAGGCDKACRLWDFRCQTELMTLKDHESDINSVQFLSSGNQFATASDDATCKLFDIRARGTLGVMHTRTYPGGYTSIALSTSGRFAFVGDELMNCHMFDTLKQSHLGELACHQNRISCVGISRDGMALCTGSWDTTLMVSA